MATDILRLWNPVQGRWYLTVREAGTAAHEREAARARKAETEIARLQALLQRQGYAPQDPLD